MIDDILDAAGIPQEGPIELSRRELKLLISALATATREAPTIEPAPAPAPVTSPLIPSGVTFGRTPKAGLSPLHAPAPAPANVHMGNGSPGARVTITPPGGGPAENYTGQLQPGQSRIEIVEGGTKLPALIRDPDGTLRPADPPPPAPAPAPAFVASQAPASIASAMASVAVSGRLAARHLDVLDQVSSGAKVRDKETAGELLGLGCLEKAPSGGYLITLMGREAGAIAKNRIGGKP